MSAIHTFHWRSLRQLSLCDVPTPLHNWLRDEGSLTQRLKQTCSGRGSFRVIPQFTGIGRARVDEAQALGLLPNQWVYRRSVELRCGAHGFVFARTVIPLEDLDRSLRQLVRLGTRSLGAVLHAARRRERSHGGFVRINTDDASCFDPALKLTQPAWARRALYRMDDRRLLVQEVFLQTPGKLPRRRSLRVTPAR